MTDQNSNKTDQNIDQETGHTSEETLAEMVNGIKKVISGHEGQTVIVAICVILDEISQQAGTNAFEHVQKLQDIREEIHPTSYGSNENLH